MPCERSNASSSAAYTRPSDLSFEVATPEGEFSCKVLVSVTFLAKWHAYATLCLLM